MLALFTDAHISPKVATQVKAKRPEITIHSLNEWRSGLLLRAADIDILRAAREENLTLVTCDQRTIARLVLLRANENREHAGVIFISKQSITQADIGAQVTTLIALWDEVHTLDSANAIYYLKQLP